LIIFPAHPRNFCSLRIRAQFLRLCATLNTAITDLETLMDDSPILQASL
jgi:hypothetical protein